MGRRKKKTDKLRQILKAAAALFIRKGYLNTSVRDIADRCNMNVATLYHYVGSKYNILNLFHEYSMELLENFVKENKQSFDEMEPGKALAYAVKGYLDWVDEYQDATVFWYQEAKNLESRQLDQLVVQEEFVVQFFQSLLERGIKERAFKVVDAYLAAHNIVVLCDMWAFRRWMLRRHYTFEEFTKVQTDLILAQANGTSLGL